MAGKDGLFRRAVPPCPAGQKSMQFRVFVWPGRLVSFARWSSGNRIVAGKPARQIEVLAAFGAERTELRVTLFAAHRTRACITRLRHRSLPGQTRHSLQT